MIKVLKNILKILKKKAKMKVLKKLDNIIIIKVILFINTNKSI